MRFRGEHNGIRQRYGLTVRPTSFANAPCRASNVTNSLVPRTRAAATWMMSSVRHLRVNSIPLAFAASLSNDVL